MPVAPKNFHDGYLVQGQSLGNLIKNVSLNADNITINPGITPFLRLTSDNATSTNRTFSLFNGQIDGQILYITLVGTTGNAAEMLSTGNAVLAGGTWTAAMDHSLTVMWDATSSKWREISRN